MRRSLLSTSILAGAALLAAPVRAGAPAISDTFKVTIGGVFRSTLLVVDQDGPATERGYQLITDEAEVRLAVSRTTDNGLLYGFNIEVQTQTDDTRNADEVWAFVDGSFGRIEVGDQDDAPDRLFAAGEDVMKGRGGYDGAVDSIFTLTGVTGASPDPSITLASDATKIIYFTPRFAGLQLGVSFTPDIGQFGGVAANDADGSFADVIGFGLNYTRKLMGVDFEIAGVASLGTHEGAATEDMRIWGVGATLAHAGFEFGGGYANFGDTGLLAANAALGADAGQWWDVGLAYSGGAWAISAGYFHGWAGNVAGTPDSTTRVFSLAGTYRVARGLDLHADLNFVDVETIGRVAGADNDGTVFVLSTVLTF